MKGRNVKMKIYFGKSGIKRMKSFLKKIRQRGDLNSCKFNEHMLQSISHQILNYGNGVPSSLQFCLWLHSLACSLSQIHKQYGIRQKLTVQGEKKPEGLQLETGMIFGFLNRICQQPWEGYSRVVSV